MVFELKEIEGEAYVVPVPHVMKATRPDIKCRGSVCVVAINLPTALVTHVRTSIRVVAT